MHDLPGAVFGSKGHRDPQIARGDILRSADLGVGPLYPQDASKFVSHVLRYGLEVVDLSIAEHGCSTLLSRSNLLPSTHGGPKGLARLTSSRWENSSCTGFGFPFTNSLPARLNRSSTSSKSSTAAIATSPPSPSSFPWTLCDNPTLFTGVR